jgi:hypothetical protein
MLTQALATLDEYIHHLECLLVPNRVREIDYEPGVDGDGLLQPILQSLPSSRSRHLLEFYFTSGKRRRKDGEVLPRARHLQNGSREPAGHAPEWSLGQETPTSRRSSRNPSLCIRASVFLP